MKTQTRTGGMTAREASYGHREVKDGPTEQKYMDILARSEARTAAREAVKAEQEAAENLAKIDRHICELRWSLVWDHAAGRVSLVNSKAREIAEAAASAEFGEYLPQYADPCVSGDAFCAYLTKRHPGFLKAQAAREAAARRFTPGDAVTVTVTGQDGVIVSLFNDDAAMVDVGSNLGPVCHSLRNLAARQAEGTGN